MSRFIVETAVPQDDADLRRLFAANPMPGEIEVAFHRDPSYFHATAVQGGFAQVFLLRDRTTGAAAGVGTRATRPGYLNGEVREVGYLADLRLDASYRSGLLFLEAFRTLAALDADGRTSLYFTVIAEGNRGAREALEGLRRLRPRADLPCYQHVGRLLSPAVNLLGRKRPLTAPGCELGRGTVALVPDIVACLNRNMARRQFAPHFHISQFTGGPPEPGYPHLHDLHPEDMYVAVRDGRVVGVLARWDQSRYKQTVVTAYHGRLRRLRPWLNVGAALLGWPRYPAPGQPVRSVYAAFPAIDEDDRAVLAALVRALYNDQVGGRDAYFLLGVHERDPLATVLDDYSVTPFAGRLYAVHFSEGAPAFAALDDRVPFVELAML